MWGGTPHFILSGSGATPLLIASAGEQLDAEALFYLRARGIGKDEARDLLTFAFANDVLGRIKVEPLRRRLEQELLAGRMQDAWPEEDRP